MDATREHEEAGNKATVIFNAHQTSGGLVNNVHGNLTMGDYQNHNHIDYVRHANIYISNIVSVDERLKDPREMDPAGPPPNEPTTNNTETGTMRSAGVAISGFLLPPIHSMPHFFTQQQNPSTLSMQTEQWTRLITAYARHRKLFMFRIEEAVTTTGEWGEVLLNERINRRILPAHLSYIFADMVAKNVAGYEPPKQTRSILVYWRLPEEWAEVLHGWLKKIMTFYEITNPPIESPLTDLPLTLLRQAIAILGKTGRAQTITVPDGEGVRFFAGSWRA